MAIQPVKADKMRIILEWGRSPSEDVIHYRLYISKGGTVSYECPFCTVPNPPGGKPSVRYNLVDCDMLAGFTGTVSMAVASVDDAYNISDLSQPIELFIDFDNIFARMYKTIWDALRSWRG